MTRQTLAQPATISIPAGDGFNPSLPLIVAKQIDVKGVAKLKLVALARQSGSLISTDIATTGITLSGITTSGTYYFLQAKEQFGYAPPFLHPPLDDLQCLAMTLRQFQKRLVFYSLQLTVIVYYQPVETICQC